MNSKVLLSSLIIGSGSIAAGGYGVYLATTPSFNPLKIATETVETAELLKKTFEELKEARKKFLGTLSEEPWKPEAGLEDPLGQNKEQLSVKEVNEQIIKSLFKNIFLSKALENLLLQELSEEIKTKMESYKNDTVDPDLVASKTSQQSSSEWTKVIDLAEKFADQVISLYSELPSLFKDKEKLFGTIKLGKDENPLKNSSYSPSLMSIPEKIFTLEGDENSKKEVVEEGGNPNKDEIKDNIFNLKISGTPILDSEGFAEALKKDGIFEVTTEKDDDSQNIKTLTLKLKKSTEEKLETMWTYFGFINQDLKEWKDIITGKKFQDIQPVPGEK